MKYLLLLFVLSGCMASGSTFNESRKNGNIIIYKNMAYVGMDAGLYGIDVNGISACKLHPGSFFIINAQKEVNISSSVWDMPGTSNISFKIEPKKIYYVRMDSSAGKQGAGALGGLVGALVAEGITKENGPFLFTLMDEKQAKEELYNLRQDCI